MQFFNPVQEAVRGCTSCVLCKVYSGPVPVSLAQPGWLVIGEAPGHEEDEALVPFIGKAGRYLRAKLKEAGVQPGRTSFCNVVSCRPHDNRDPSQHERNMCRGNLLAQINVAQPRVIIATGKFALQALYPIGVLKNDVGRVLFYGKMDGHNRWIVPTYHPSYILRGNKSMEPVFEKHLKLAASILSNKPTFPDTCKVCKGDVTRYDIMGGAWCDVHYREVPRTIYQNELPGMESTYDMSRINEKKKQREEARDYKKRMKQERGLIL